MVRRIFLYKPAEKRALYTCTLYTRKTPRHHAYNSTFLCTQPKRHIPNAPHHLTPQLVVTYPHSPQRTCVTQPDLYSYNRQHRRNSSLATPFAGDLEIYLGFPYTESHCRPNPGFPWSQNRKPLQRTYDFRPLSTVVRLRIRDPEAVCDDVAQQEDGPVLRMRDVDQLVGVSVALLLFPMYRKYGR